MFEPHERFKNNENQIAQFALLIVKKEYLMPPQRYRLDIEMTTVSGAFNNLLGSAATPQQRPGNTLVTNILEHSKAEFHRIFKTSIALDRRK